MTSKSFRTGRPSALESRFEAQRIAFAPVVFQAVRIARDRGVLRALEAARDAGLKASEIATATGLSEYAVRVLCETALSAGVLDLKDDAYVLTMTGHWLQNDELTRGNMDFVNDVCYEALARLEDSLVEGRPAGLEVFGSWSTIYEALSELPTRAKESWFRFDHLYSDSAFPEVVEKVARARPRSLLDIGGNTGKWARMCVARIPEVEVTIADLPGQLDMAKRNLESWGFSARVHLHPVDMLDAGSALPGGFDVVWMSQFLCCFSEEQVVRILRKAAGALGPEGRLFVLDTFWDRQKHDIAAYCIINTSPYFTCLANGNSRMYRIADMERCVFEAGLAIEEVVDGLGLGHSLLCLRRCPHTPIDER